MNYDALETFWYWITERHNIYLRKALGEPKPWTDDYILRSWKFCNPFRKNDRQTKALYQNITFPHQLEDPELLIFNIYLFRAFNWWDTYHAIGGWQTDWNEPRTKHILYELTSKGHKLTSSAYMIRGRDGQKKYESIPEIMTQVWDDRWALANYFETPDNCTLEHAYDFLRNRGYYGWGNFTTYQVVLDLFDSPILKDACDVNTWCTFGPGAKRGLACIWPNIRNNELLEKARWLQEVSELSIQPPTPPLNLQDIEFSLCELGKYLRIKNGGHGKETYAGS